ncbi:MAG: HAD family hydrolase [Acetobacteraceae bacterium]|nr:HAD family hydrolase [Acetobacteraceae bacterium]
MSQEAAAFLRARRRPLELVIFDCDGVLIDSEGLCNRIVAGILTADGWPMTPEECEHRFIGMSFYAMQPVIETRLGRSLGHGWVDRVVADVTEAMAREVEPMPGGREALEAVTAMGLPWRIASNSSHEEMDAKFRRAGWLDLVSGRLHSAVDAVMLGGAGKPAPDVFLAAARAEGIDPAGCLVIEDSVHGVTAARAAGMDCLGLVLRGDGAALRAAGAIPFRSMHDLPALLKGALA